ncbi:hypothetical protein [Amycolatopsis aidingensis]|nr:hypothetical protein [Amycolatopsis aidingensis]
MAVTLTGSPAGRRSPGRETRIAPERGLSWKIISQEVPVHA